MTIVDELTTLISFKFTGAQDLERANRGYLDLKTKISDLVHVLGELADRAIEPIRSVMELGHETYIASMRLGVATDKLQELRFAATVSGVSAEGLTHALEHLARSSYEASEGHQEQAKAFGALGVSIRDGSGKLKTADVLFGEMADKVAKITDPAKATALAMQVMGRAGGELVPLLKEGSAGLAAFAEEAREANMVMSPEAIARAQRLFGSWHMVSATAEGLSRRLGTGLLPIAQRVVDTMSMWQKANQAFLNDKIDRVVTWVSEATVKFVKVLWDVVDVAKYAWRDLDAIAQTLGGWEPILEVVGAALVGKFTIGLAQAAWSMAEFAAVSILAEAPMILLGVALAAVSVAAAAVYQDVNDANGILKQFRDEGDQPNDTNLVKFIKTAQNAALALRDTLRDIGELTGIIAKHTDGVQLDASARGAFGFSAVPVPQGPSDVRQLQFDDAIAEQRRLRREGLRNNGLDEYGNPIPGGVDTGANYDLTHPGKFSGTVIGGFTHSDTGQLVRSPAGVGDWSPGPGAWNMGPIPGSGVLAPPLSNSPLALGSRDIVVTVNQNFNGPPADAAGVREAGRAAGNEVATKLGRAVRH